MAPPSPVLTADQLAVVSLPYDRRIFLQGVAGTGKTTAGVARLVQMLQDGIPADSVLVLVPQRTLGVPYAEALRRPAVPPGGEATVLTLGGLAQRMIELFWPLAAGPAGFAWPERPPVFLTLETAQYYMARMVRPLLDEGYFDSISIDRNRLYSQILDNLNKAAVVGFPLTEIAPRLKGAWIGESAQARVYDEAQECAERFRAYCLSHNLLDFSLQYEVFLRHLWAQPACRNYLVGRYAHIIADNIEEDTPAAHDLLAEWLPLCRSALVIRDREAGYRRFLGADPASALRLQTLCGEQFTFTESLIASAEMRTLERTLAWALGRRSRGPAAARDTAGGQRAPAAAEEMQFAAPPATPATGQGGPWAETSEAGPAGVAPGPGARPADLSALDFEAKRYQPEMLDWVADEIAQLVHGRGVPPAEIAVLAPFVSGSLRFSLTNRLEARDVPVRSHRPSRALREEPATLCLLTLATLCHPGWGIVPTRYDVAHALMLAIDELDAVRAQLLADIAYRVVGGVPILGSFSDIEPPMQERITFLLGGRYEGLRNWLKAHTVEVGPGGSASPERASGGAESPGARPPQGPGRGRRGRGGRVEPLDHFLGRLFGELLSQPGYRFHGSLEAGEVAANLIESVRKFRQVMAWAEVPDLGREYVQMVRDGVVAAQYVRSWQRQPREAVLLAPAYTFLMTNRPVDHQFWLDVGSIGWWERLDQPLTHPYVLSRNWPAHMHWTDADEYAARQDMLAAVTLGLIRRCRVKVHLCFSEVGEQGTEQRGPLLQAIQRALRSPNARGV